MKLTCLNRNFFRATAQFLLENLLTLNSALISLILFIGIFLSCNKNTDQLPAVEPIPKKISITAYVDGLSIADFIFEQITSANGDTVWLSVKNNTATDITNMTYIVELCKAIPQSYDNCNLQVTTQISKTLKVDSTLKRIYSWVNKGISLEPSHITAGIISYNGAPTEPLANVYSSLYASFETDTTTDSPHYYGEVRGYILTDGTAIFRLKGIGNINYNTSGLFTQLKWFDGLFTKSDSTITPVTLEPMNVGTNKILIDTTLGHLKFRMRLQTPLDDTIKYIFVLTKKYY